MLMVGFFVFQLGFMRSLI